MATISSKATIFDLPLYDVLFPRIFCYLDAWEVWGLRTVSARFCRVCWKYFRSSLTTLCVDLTTYESREDTIGSVLNKLTAAKEIARVSTQLKNFSVHMASSMTRVLGRGEIEDLLNVVADAAPQIEQLCIANLESMLFSPSVAKRLGQCCCQLTKLMLWNVNPEGASFDVIFQNILCQPITTLTELSLSTITFCEKDTLSKSVAKTPSLKKLTVNNISIDNRVYGEVFRMLPKLEVVDLRYCFSLEERTIRILVEFCSQLKELYLDKTNLSHSMTPELMKSIQSHRIHVDITLSVNSNTVPYVFGQM